MNKTNCTSFTNAPELNEPASVWLTGDEDPEVLKLLLTLDQPDPEQRREAASQMWFRHDRRGLVPLLVALHDANTRVRNVAAMGLGFVGDVRAVEPLIAALQDEQADVRTSAARSLGRLRDARAIEPLLAALRDDNSYVQSAAAGALGQLGTSAPLSQSRRFWTIKTRLCRFGQWRLLANWAEVAPSNC